MSAAEPWVVYIAGPLTTGDPVENRRLALEAAAHLLADADEAGLVVWPVVPHTMLEVDALCPREYEDWMAGCFAVLDRCDALIRLPGASSGADREVEFAQAEGISVFYAIHEFIHHATTEP